MKYGRPCRCIKTMKGFVHVVFDVFEEKQREGGSLTLRYVCMTYVFGVFVGMEGRD